MTSAPQIVRPANYEVSQRIDGRAAVPVHITGVGAGAVAVRIVDRGGKTIAQREYEIHDGEFSGGIEVLEGGWYQLTVRAVGAGGRAGLSPAVHFGVGDVFIVAGQSNAAGTGDGFIPDRSGLVSVQTPDGDWALAGSPDRMPERMVAGSPWPVLGELLASVERVPIGFINVAVGGTSTAQWQPDGALYPALRRALTGRRVRAILWHQGEQDTGDAEMTSERIFQNMVTIINRSRVDAGWQVPWYVALASHSSRASDEAKAKVRAAQTLLWRKGFASPGPDTDTYVTDSMRYDGVHFNQVGLVVHALLWFRALYFAG